MCSHNGGGLLALGISATTNPAVSENPVCSGITFHLQCPLKIFQRPSEVIEKMIITPHSSSVSQRSFLSYSTVIKDHAGHLGRLSPSPPLYPEMLMSTPNTTLSSFVRFLFGKTHFYSFFSFPFTTFSHIKKTNCCTSLKLERSTADSNHQ